VTALANESARTSSWRTQRHQCDTVGIFFLWRKIMHLYLVPKGRLCDMRAAIEMLKELYDVEFRGLGYGMGMVYATDREVQGIHMESLGLIPWV